MRPLTHHRGRRSLDRSPDLRPGQPFILLHKLSAKRHGRRNLLSAIPLRRQYAVPAPLAGLSIMK